MNTTGKTGKDIKERFGKALSRTCNDKIAVRKNGNSKGHPAGHYVYALIDPRDNAIFYVGEGHTDRVLNHEKELKDKFTEMEDEIKQNEELSEEDRREHIAAIKTVLSDKLKLIEAIEKDNKEVKHIIIKHGLTQEEAFWVESAIINILQYAEENRIKISSLYNIVNGHATGLEKESRVLSDQRKTKARNEEQFILECGHEELDIIKNEDKAKTEEYQYIDEEILRKAIFINIRQSAANCYDERHGLDREKLWNAVRGCWKAGYDKAKKVEYIFATQGALLIDVFKINKGNVNKILSNDNKKFPKNPIRKDDEEYSFAQDIASVYSALKVANKKEEEIKQNITYENKELLDSFCKFQKEDVGKEKYAKDVKVSVGKYFRNELGDGATSPINKKILELSRTKAYATDQSMESKEKLIDLLVEDDALFESWRRNKFKNYLGRIYFYDYISDISDEEKEKLEGYKNKVLMLNAMEYTTKKTKKKKQDTASIQIPSRFGVDMK